MQGTYAFSIPFTIPTSTYTQAKVGIQRVHTLPIPKYYRQHPQRCKGPHGIGLCIAHNAFKNPRDNTIRLTSTAPRPNCVGAADLLEYLNMLAKQRLPRLTTHHLVLPFELPSPFSASAARSLSTISIDVRLGNLF